MEKYSIYVLTTWDIKVQHFKVLSALKSLRKYHLHFIERWKCQRMVQLTPLSPTPLSPTPLHSSYNAHSVIFLRNQNFSHKTNNTSPAALTEVYPSSLHNKTSQYNFINSGCGMQYTHCVLELIDIVLKQLLLYLTDLFLLCK